MINYSNLKIDLRAAKEIVEIFEWYEREKDNLGKKFRNDVDKAFQKILKSPLAFSKIKKHSKIRRIILTHFPYKIFYNPSTEPITIIAVIHFSRSPKYTNKRIK